MGVIRPALFLALALLASACAITQRPPLSKGAAYAAMGSSFAAGPGITAPGAPPSTSASPT
jgi:hypothetical protein